VESFHRRSHKIFFCAKQRLIHHLFPRHTQYVQYQNTRDLSKLASFHLESVAFCDVISISTDVQEARCHQEIILMESVV